MRRAFAEADLALREFETFRQRDALHRSYPRPLNVAAQ
jgi:hypothetical protein